MATLAINQSITRNSSLPLDYYSVFETYAKLTTYCSSIRAYAGQIVAVTSDSDKNGAYVLTGVKPFTPVKIGDSSSTNKTNFTILTTAEYEALTNKDANTIYFCTETDDDSDDSDDSDNSNSNNSSNESSTNAITADKSEIECSNVGSTDYIIITSSSDVTYTNPDWVTISLDSTSSGDTKKYAISISAYTNTSPRTGNIVFTNSDGNTVTVVIKQSGIIKFSISVNTDPISANSTTFTGKVTAYNISSDTFNLYAYRADNNDDTGVSVTYTPSEFTAAVGGRSISFTVTVPVNNTSDDIAYIIKACNEVGNNEEATYSVIQSAKS
jgi:hypothetical protein